MRAWLKESDADAEKVFLSMCFFVNNQYRILVKKETHGAAELEQVFESNLKRIGNVIAILDTFRSPVYLTRIWTIFEQFTSVKLDVPVHMILPEEAGKELLEQLKKGEEGIQYVKEEITKVDCENAKASMPEDEEAVKELIKQHFKFEYVDEKIVEFMLQWVSKVMAHHLKTLVTAKKVRTSATHLCL